MTGVQTCALPICADDALGATVTFGGAHERRTRLDAPERDLVLEIVGQVLGAVIVTKCKTRGNPAADRAEDGASSTIRPDRRAMAGGLHEAPDMELLQSINNTAFSQWVRESDSLLAYPAFITLHTAGLAVLVGIGVATYRRERKQKVEEPKYRMLDED